MVALLEPCRYPELGENALGGSAARSAEGLCLSGQARLDLGLRPKWGHSPEMIGMNVFRWGICPSRKT
jgi:hypothetical protein